ncbi:MAG: permease-like cell division protein FtsX [bacterium]|nr:permease-like cell division protein FtsX [bacterium]
MSDKLPSSQSLKRIVSSGWVNFRRNSFMSFGATGVMALALLVFSGLIVLNFFTSQVVTFLDEKVDVSVYFQNDAKEDQILEIKSDLEEFGNVRTVNYISQDQALEDFKNRHRNDQLIQDSIVELDSNPLQASLNVKAVDPSQYASIAQFLEGNALKTVIDKISFYENELAINRIRGISNTFSRGGLGVTLLLAMVAVLVTFNTIRLTIYNKREEIEIMKLVGATNWHIRGPFLVEGGFYGLFASLLTLAVFYPSTYFISNKLLGFAPDINLFNHYLGNIGQMFFIVIGAGLLIGVFSSFIAIRKHLKV